MVLVSLALASCGESMTASFTNMHEVQASGLIERGWIPPELPSDATDIRVSWNLDSNRSTGSYQAATLIDSHARNSCKALGAGGKAYRCSTYYLRREEGRNTFDNEGDY